MDITPVVRKLLIINVSVWGAQVLFGLAGSTLLTDLFALDPHRVLPWRPWQVVTYMFLHSAPAPHHPWSIWHIVFNCLLLAFMGGPVERRLGGSRFLRFYLLCGVSGGLLTMLPPFQAVTLGASGAVFGVLTAFGLLFPNMPLYILFLFAVPAKYVVIGLAIFQLLSAMSSSSDGVSYIAHIGGMATGYLLLRGVPFVDVLRRKVGTQRQEQKAQRIARGRRSINEILDKYNAEGRESLTQEEWNTLLEESRRTHDGK
jgi:membrane associated rhomboid family serine protease